ncbi:MAG TPA: hypothetical protein VJ696_13985 [Rhodanobacteraceae bacterium]|nr:hypothetical protein [Rhodanobacteraceae bacterium]
MKSFVTTAVTSLALLAIGASSAHADVVNIPASAGMQSGASSNRCSVSLGTLGITTTDTCAFELPISIPVGRTIQQIDIIHSTNSSCTDPYLEAALWSVDYSTSRPTISFPWSSSEHVSPDGMQQSNHLMAEMAGSRTMIYPDAFVVQPDTMYNVVIMVEDCAQVAGLQVTYQ